MNSEFARAMSHATASVRAGKLVDATALIQAALAGRPEPGAASASPAQARRVAPDIEDAEVVDVWPAAPPAPESGPRRSLREVLTLLRGGRAMLDDIGPLTHPGSRPPAPQVPEGARFLWRDHACAAGTRRYRLFIPSCPRSELRGLVMMLHGCKQDPDDFAVGTGMNALAEEARMIVAYPEQPGAANISRCWNWFEPAHQARDGGEPAILADIARELAKEFAIAAPRVYVAGLSAGGAMAAVLGATHPDVFAAVGIHSGLPYRSASNVASAFAAMRGQGPGVSRPAAGHAPRTIVFHGESDRTVHPSNATALVAGLAADREETRETGRTAGRGWSRLRRRGADGRTAVELWFVEGAGHAWSGGDAAGSFTDACGPSASAEMLRFFAGE
ncbi:MAG: poly(3-hydroxybutyrate) depolymerase [Rhodovulum sulfidophilum]|uniref:Poly(3-hydroxybutyrate) depolymerase n=1 Tax=Rhodovulum sulfidophilum TaxID=35806 RepID=A0A2W5PP77_RHOSU|nr:MAG: poly(3-hydroxybutyrate) depolymerase [Rhodovulum sulfidophilum]